MKRRLSLLPIPLRIFVPFGTRFLALSPNFFRGVARLNGDRNDRNVAGTQRTSTSLTEVEMGGRKSEALLHCTSARFADDGNLIARRMSKNCVLSRDKNVSMAKIFLEKFFYTYYNYMSKN